MLDIKLPEVIAGPIVRKVLDNKLTIWLVTSQAYDVSLALFRGEEERCFFSQQLSQSQHLSIAVGKNAYINLLTLDLDDALLEDTWISYQINLHNQYGNFDVSQLSDLLYLGQTRPRFWYSKNANKVLHGSCRKPHHDSMDGLLAVDQHLVVANDNKETPASLLMMSGDQVYVDDVAGPMLFAIHQVVKLLGLHDDPAQNVSFQSELLNSTEGYYQREKILPCLKSGDGDLASFFSGKSKPIFTSVSAHNHLVSFSEMMAMYFLVWSPEMWNLIEFSSGGINKKHQKRYQNELIVIEHFKDNLAQVRRALAHIPCYMIFDDHDVTDDWNLTRGWEDAAYGHDFSKRIIGNALLSYWLCQGWGNQVDAFDSIYQQAQACFSPEGINDSDNLLDTLLSFDQWHYSLATSPKLVVLDTRTHRWRSETNKNQPSGLMDWEALSELQLELCGESAVILVSPAPIFGVKLIEVIQRIFTFWGLALTVDAENWMAHKGTASVILNIFQHSKTPPHFVILSGDVHYSFVYDVVLRRIKNSPQITQITSSGIKNQFPVRLLAFFAKLNRILYGQKSPLNLFTKRRRMKVIARTVKGQELLNHSGIGLLDIDEDHHVTAKQISANGEEFTFKRDDN